MTATGELHGCSEVDSLAFTERGYGVVYCRACGAWRVTRYADDRYEVGRGLVSYWAALATLGAAERPFLFGLSGHDGETPEMAA